MLHPYSILPCQSSINVFLSHNIVAQLFINRLIFQENLTFFLALCIFAITLVRILMLFYQSRMHSLKKLSGKRVSFISF